MGVCAVTAVKREDQSEFEKLCENFKSSFNDNADHRRRWGGGIMGMKSQHKTAKIQPRVNLSRVVKWPKYVTLQRKKAILLKRLKSPPAVNQFNAAIDKNQAAQLLRLLRKYSPETMELKKRRFVSMAKA